MYVDFPFAEHVSIVPDVVPFLTFSISLGGVTMTQYRVHPRRQFTLLCRGVNDTRVNTSYTDTVL